MIKKQRFNMILGAPDIWAFSIIMDYTGHESRGAIVRELLRERAREIRREQAQAREQMRAQERSIKEGVQ